MKTCSHLYRACQTEGNNSSLDLIISPETIQKRINFIYVSQMKNPLKGLSYEIDFENVDEN